MKTRSIFFSQFVALAWLALFSMCTGNKSNTTETHAHAHDSTTSAVGVTQTTPQFDVNESFQRQLSETFMAYIKLKDAFVLSDAEKVKAEASNTSKTLSSVDMNLLSGAAHHDWMNLLSVLENSLKEIESTSDIEVQRKAFSALSDALYKSIKAFGAAGKETYYDYCPMAFNNEGAYWLSDQEQIRNPYFGNKMMTCGQVKEKIK